MNPIKQSLSNMRGEPSKCDFCKAPKTLEELEPEEAGMWVCRGCQKRWDQEDLEKREWEVGHLLSLQSRVTAGTWMSMWRQVGTSKCHEMVCRPLDFDIAGGSKKWIEVGGVTVKKGTAQQQQVHDDLKYIAALHNAAPFLLFAASEYLRMKKKQ